MNVSSSMKIETRTRDSLQQRLRARAQDHIARHGARSTTQGRSAAGHVRSSALLAKPTSLTPPSERTR